MEFRLNGGPRDGEVIEVSDHYLSGQGLVVPVYDGDEVSYYVCPSEDDYDKRDLFWSIENPYKDSKTAADQDQYDRWLRADPYTKKLIADKKSRIKKDLMDEDPHRQIHPPTKSSTHTTTHWQRNYATTSNGLYKKDIPY